MTWAERLVLGGLLLLVMLAGWVMPGFVYGGF